MSVLDREALEQSPLADLHAIASELGLDGYRRLRKADLIDAILGKQSDEGGGSGASDEARSDDQAASDHEVASDHEAASDDEAPSDDDDERPSGRRRRGRRGGRGRAASRGADDDHADAARKEPEEREEREEREQREEPEEREEEPEERRPARSRRRGSRGGASAESDRESAPDSASEAEPQPAPAEETVEGDVDLLPNGSAFVRVNPPEPSDDDVYVSAAQVKRCELVSGDRISGPRRAPRRSERFASLVRIDTINGRPASEVAEGARFDDLPSAFPNDRFRLGSEDPTLKAIEWLTPFGKGSRVTITGSARAGKTEALRRLGGTLAGHEDVQLFVVVSGVRPEEISEWNESSTQPMAASSFASSPDTQAHTIELVLDRARRAATRGGDAVVLIDTLDGLSPNAARKAIAAARNIVDGGSLTVIATAREELGGETTVIALDATLAAAGRFPALDMIASGTMRPELLVGDAGAAAIARARAVAEESEPV